MATQNQSTQSHFHLMVHTLSLAHQTIQYGCGICHLNLATFRSRQTVPLIVQHIQDGFFLPTDKPTLCLCHLMLCYLTPISLPYPTLLLPMLILPMQPLALNGMIVILHSSVLNLFYLLMFYQQTSEIKGFSLKESEISRGLVSHAQRASKFFCTAKDLGPEKVPIRPIPKQVTCFPD